MRKKPSLMASRAMPMPWCKHAEGALNHAEAAQKDVKNPHLDEGIKHLKEAVEHGKAGHADVATQHAEGAVTHLSEVK